VSENTWVREQTEFCWTFCKKKIEDVILCQREFDIKQEREGKEKEDE